MMMMAVRELREATSEELCLSKNTGVNPHEDDFWHLTPILPGSAGLCICFLTLSGNDVCWVAHLLQGGNCLR